MFNKILPQCTDIQEVQAHSFEMVPLFSPFFLLSLYRGSSYNLSIEAKKMPLLYKVQFHSNVKKQWHAKKGENMQQCCKIVL